MASFQLAQPHGEREPTIDVVIISMHVIVCTYIVYNYRHSCRQTLAIAMYIHIAIIKYGST